MFGQRLSTSATQSTATATSRPSLFKRVIYNLQKVFKRSNVEAKRGLGEKEQIVLPEPSPETLAHPAQEANVIEKQSIRASNHCTIEKLAPSLTPSPPPSPAADETSDTSTPHTSSPGLSTSTSPPPTPSTLNSPLPATSTAASSIRSPQVTSELEAGNKKIGELEALIAKRRLEHAAYVKKIEKMDLPRAIKITTEDRDLFRARLEPAEKELARKAAEHEAMGQKWHIEYESRLMKQLRMLGAKRGLEDQAKEYAELEAKVLELQSQVDSA